MSIMTENIETVFALLRPLCVEIAQKPFDYNSLNRLRLEISRTTSTDGEIWRCLFDYIVFPLRLLLRRASSSTLTNDNGNQKEKIEKCLIAVLEIFRDLIDRCGGEFNRPDVVVSLLSDVFLLVNNPPGSEEVTESNRLIIAVADFATNLLTCADQNRISTDDGAMRKKLIENQPILAQTVFALVRCLKKSSRIDDDEGRTLQASIVRCLSTVLALDDQVSSAFLPGVASGLADLVLRLCSNLVSSREQFIVECLEIWTKVVMAANAASSNQTEEWRRNASLQLSSIVERLASTLVSHPSITIRRSLFDMALRFLSVPENDDDNKSILCDCQKRCLEVVAASVADDQLQIDASSLADLRRRYGGLLEKMLISTCWRLPRFSKSPLSTQQRIDWRCLLGYLRLLDDHGLSDFLLIDDHKEALFSALINSVELADVTEEIRPTGEVPEESVQVKTIDPSTFRRRLHLASPSDPQAKELVLSTCQELAKMQGLNGVYDYLYQLCGRSDNHRLPAMFILNSLFSSGRPPATSDLLLSFVDLFLTNLRNAKSLSAVDACLNLEGLGHCSMCLKEEFRPSFIEAFYVVLTLLRYSDYKDYVWATLFDFARALDYDTVSDMVVSNSDYLSSSLTFRLRRFTLHPDSASILASLLDILPWEAITTYRGTILETLRTIDHFASYPEQRVSIALLLQVLERFCAFVASKTPASENRKAIPTGDDEGHKKPVPWHIQLISDILQRIRSWVFVDGIPTRLASLRVLEAGLNALAHVEDQLLPLVHQTWPATSARLGDVLENSQDERLIVVSTAAFQVVTTMAAVSRSFVGRRIQEAAWPKLKRILQQFLPTTKRANALVYGQSPSFRLQLAILEKLAEICKHIGASEGFLNEAMDLCRTYDSENVLPALKRAATASLEDMGKLKIPENYAI